VPLKHGGAKFTNGALLSDHSDDYLPEYVLGLLEGEPRQSVEEHLSECPRCAARATELGGAMAPSPYEARSTPPPVSTRPKLRLAVTPEQPHGRFYEYAERVSELFDVRVHRAAALLELIDDPSCWVPGPVSGIVVFPVEAGARREGARTVIMRASPGTRLPLHEHAGDEHTLVLQGGYLESTGREVSCGEAASSAAGSSHWVEVLPGEECIACVITAGPKKDLA
jgi:putative transcriptional regulator